MIDVENEIITIIREALPQNVLVVSTDDDVPSKFPCVYVEEMDSYNDNKSMTSSRADTYDVVMYQVYVYSNKNQGAKSECKALVKIVDDTMRLYGFERKVKQPLGRLVDFVKYAYVLRYVGEVGAKDTYKDGKLTKHIIYKV